MGVHCGIEGGFGFGVRMDTKPQGKFKEFVDEDDCLDETELELYVAKNYEHIGYAMCGNFMVGWDEQYHFFYVKSTHFYVGEIYDAPPMNEIKFSDGRPGPELEELQRVAREFELSRPSALVFVNTG